MNKFRVQRTVRALAAAALFVAAMPMIGHAQKTERGKTVGRKLMCMCGGCNDSATGCQHSGGTFSGACDVAKGMQKSIDKHIDAGDSDQQINDAFVAEYGPTVQLEPPTHGFNLLAWVMPIALPLAALVIVWEVVRRWRKKTALVAVGGPAFAGGVDPALLERAKREVGKDDVE
jgi:cytochrome c-type biogenesis protein CcmH/NrfF